MTITKIPIIQINKNGTIIEVNPTTSINDIGVSSGTLKLSSAIVDRELAFGEMISSQFSVQLFNIDDNLEGCGIQLFLEENGVRISKFKGVIDSSKRDNIGGYRDIVAYDWIYYHRNDDISSWWNSFWVNTRTSATIQEIRISLLTYINMIDIKGYPSNSIYPSNELYPQDITDSYINDSIVIPNNFNFYTDLKLHIILKMICELQAVFPHIDENGNMEFISITNTNTSDLTGLYEGSNSKWEDYTTEAITGIGIYSTSNALTQLIGTADNVYNISGNLFALALNAQTLNTLGNNILNAISSIQFTPSKIKMITTNFDLVLGQRVSTPKGYGYVMTNSLSGVCLIEQTIESKSMGSKLSQRVDSRNDTLIEGAKMSKFEQTIDGFTTEVQRIDQVATEAQETADGLADDVQTANNNASTALSTANNANTTAITAQSQVTQMADQIVLKVDNNGNVVQVALSSDASTGSNVLIKGDNIQLDGNVTITSGFVLNVGTIQSQNYAEDSYGYATQGMKIKLSDGTLNTPAFRIDTDGAYIVDTLFIAEKQYVDGVFNGHVTKIPILSAKSLSYTQLYHSYSGLILSYGESYILENYEGGGGVRQTWIYGGHLEFCRQDVGISTTTFNTAMTITIPRSNNTTIGHTDNNSQVNIFGTLAVSNLTTNRILVSDANKNIVSSGYEFDISTNNTSDTWLLVMNGTKIQHRLSTNLSVNYATSAGSATNATKITVTSNNPTYSTPAQWGSFSGDGAKLCWFDTANKIANQPAQYGFLLHLGLSYGEGHQIWTTQTNGNLLHRGFNDGSNLASIPFKTILDSSNYSSYALPLSGGNVTGKLRLNNISELYNLSNTLILGSGDGVSARKYNNLNTYILMSASGFVNQSSRLVKENVEPITEERAKKILNLNVVTFDYIKEVGGAKNKAGLIAEDTLDILPDIVTVPTNYNEEKTKQKIKNNEAADVMSIDYSKLTPYLVKIAQIHQRQLQELKQSNNFYQNIILQMQAEIEQIKQKTEE